MTPVVALWVEEIGVNNSVNSNLDQIVNVIVNKLAHLVILFGS